MQTRSPKPIHIVLSLSLLLQSALANAQALAAGTGAAPAGVTSPGRPLAMQTPTAMGFGRSIGEAVFNAAGIGAGLGLVVGLGKGESVGESMLKGAGAGLGVLVVVAMGAGVAMPVSPRHPASLEERAPLPFGATATRWIELPLGGRRGAGGAGSAWLLGVGAGPRSGARLSWVKTW